MNSSKSPQPPQVQHIFPTDKKNYRSRVTEKWEWEKPVVTVVSVVDQTDFSELEAILKVAILRGNIFFRLVNDKMGKFILIKKIVFIGNLFFCCSKFLIFVKRSHVFF